MVLSLRGCQGEEFPFNILFAKQDKLPKQKVIARGALNIIWRS